MPHKCRTWSSHVQQELSSSPSDDDTGVAGTNGRISKSVISLCHAVMHFHTQVVYGGHFSFYDTMLSERSHRETITLLGMAVRKRSDKETARDMLRLHAESKLLRQIGSAYIPSERRYQRAARPSENEYEFRVVDLLLSGRPAANPRGVVDTHVPLTWAEILTLLSRLAGTQRQTSRRAVRVEQNYLLALNWCWALKVVFRTSTLDRRFEVGDVYRFRGLDRDNRTALVGQASNADSDIDHIQNFYI